MLPTFPSRYWSSVGLPGVFSLAGWSPLFLTGFLVSRHTQGTPSVPPRYRYGGITLYAPDSHPVPVPFQHFMLAPLLPRRGRNRPGLGSVRFDRHYSGHRCFFLFLQVLRCFSSLRSPRLLAVSDLQPDGFPHSDIVGSILACRSPTLFAACHVLLRLRKPRHPPCALIAFLRSSAGLSIAGSRLQVISPAVSAFPLPRSGLP